MNFQPNQKVEWHFTTSRGWGASWWVPATVVKIGRSKITIDALLKNGETKRVAVKPEKLRIVASCRQSPNA